MKDQPPPVVAPTDAQLLAAFAAMNPYGRDMLLAMARDFARDFAAHPKPSLRVIVGPREDAFAMPIRASTCHLSIVKP